MLATGFPAYDWKPNSDAMKHIENIVGKARSVRIIGAASLDLCMVATGQLTGFFHDGLHPWDVAAGIIILKEAGGTVTNREGNEYRLGDHIISCIEYTDTRSVSITTQLRNRLIKC